MSLTIGGVAVDAWLEKSSLEYGNALTGEPDTLRFSLAPLGTNGAPCPELVPGVEVRFVIDGTAVFGGSLEAPQHESIKGFVRYACTAVDWRARLDQRVLNARRRNQTAGQMIQYLVKRYAPAFDASGVDLTGTILPAIRFKPPMRLTEALDLLAGHTGWVWDVDADRRISWGPPGTSIAPFALHDLSRDFDGFTLTEDRTELANRVVVFGAKTPAPDATTEYFSGDGVTRHFRLSRVPFGQDDYLLFDDGFSGFDVAPGGAWVQDDVTNPTPPAGHIGSDGYLFTTAVSGGALSESGWLQIVGGNGTWGASRLMSSQVFGRGDGGRRFELDVYAQSTTGEGRFGLWDPNDQGTLAGEAYGVFFDDGVIKASVGGATSGTTLAYTGGALDSYTRLRITLKATAGALIEAQTGANYGSRTWTTLLDTASGSLANLTFSACFNRTFNGRADRARVYGRPFGVAVKVGGVAQPVGQLETDNDAGVPCVVGASTGDVPVLVFFPDSIPAAGTRNIEVTYYETRQIRQGAEDAVSIIAAAALEGSDGIHEKWIEAPEVDTVELARTRARQELALYKDHARSISYTTRTPGLRAGQVQRIDLTTASRQRPVQGEFLLTQVTTRADGTGGWTFDVQGSSRLKGPGALLLELLRGGQRMDVGDLDDGSLIEEMLFAHDAFGLKDICPDPVAGPRAPFRYGDLPAYTFDSQADWTAGTHQGTQATAGGLLAPATTLPTFTRPGPAYVLDAAGWTQVGESAATNLLSAADASFEGGTVGTWTGVGTATVANSTAWSAAGTRSLLVSGAESTSTTSAATNYANLNVSRSPSGFYYAGQMTVYNPGPTAIAVYGTLNNTDTDRLDLAPGESGILRFEYFSSSTSSFAFRIGCALGASGDFHVDKVMWARNVATPGAWVDGGVNRPAVDHAPRYVTRGGLAGLLLERAAESQWYRANLHTAWHTETGTPIPSDAPGFGPFRSSIRFDDLTGNGALNHGSGVYGYTGELWSLSAFVVMDDGGAPVPGTSTGGGTAIDLYAAIAGAAPTAAYAEDWSAVMGPGVWRVVWQRVLTANYTSTGWSVAKAAAHSTRGFRVSGVQLEKGPPTTLMLNWAVFTESRYSSAGQRQAETLRLPGALAVSPGSGALAARVWLEGDTSAATASADHYLFDTGAAGSGDSINRAPLGTHTASGSVSASWTPDNLADGYRYHATNNGWQSPAASLPGSPWVQVDLGAVVAVDQLRWFAGTSVTSHPYAYTIKVSTTGAFAGEETTVVTVAGTAPVASAWTTHAFAPTNARYVRMVVTASGTTGTGTYVEFPEWEVYGAAACSNRIALYQAAGSPGTWRARVWDAAGTAYTAGWSGTLARGAHVLAVAWGAGQVALWIDGTKVATATATLPTALGTDVWLGSNLDGLAQVDAAVAWAAGWTAHPGDPPLADAATATAEPPASAAYRVGFAGSLVPSLTATHTTAWLDAGADGAALHAVQPAFARTGGAIVPGTGTAVASGAPRSAALAGESGLYVEEGTTNIMGVTNGRAAGMTVDPQLVTPTAALVADGTNPWGSQHWLLTIPAGSARGSASQDAIHTNIYAWTPLTTYTATVWVAGADLGEWTIQVNGTQGVGTTAATGRTLDYAGETWREYGLTATKSSSTGNEGFFFFRRSGSANTAPIALKVAWTQMEQKAYRTSPVAGTRADEALTFATAGLLRPTQGAVLVRFYWDGVSQGTNRMLFDTSGGGAATDRIALYLDAGGTWRARVWGADGTTVASADLANPFGVGWHALAMAWDATDVVLYADGGAVPVATAPVVVPAAAVGTSGNVGHNYAAGSHFNGAIRRFVAYYDRPDAAELARLTAPGELPRPEAGYRLELAEEVQAYAAMDQGWSTLTALEAKPDGSDIVRRYRGQASPGGGRRTAWSTDEAAVRGRYRQIETTFTTRAGAAGLPAVDRYDLGPLPGTYGHATYS